MKMAVVLIMVSIIIFSFAAFPANAEEKYVEQWNKVTAAENEGRPQTAIEALKEIQTKASSAGEGAIALKALCKIIVMESVIKGNKPQEKIVRLAAEIEKAPAADRTVMKAILAQWYWQYFSNNKYRFMDRTRTAGAAGDDFTTWDLPRLFNKIAALHNEVLADSEALKKIPVANYYEIMDKGNAPSAYRPTMFDFAAHKALEFFTSGEQAAALPQDAYDISAASAAFADAENFMKFDPETSDTASPKLAAVRIFQRLLEFHKNDTDRDAFLDCDIARLRYVRNVAVGDKIADIFIERMKRIASEYKKSDLASLALYLCAQELYDRGEYVEAKKIADEGAAIHSGSFGASECRALIAEITGKSLEITAERSVVANKKSKIFLKYRNIDSASFRVYKQEWKKFVDGDDSNFGWISDEKLEALLQEKPAAEWTSPLTPTSNFKQSQAPVEVPELKNGLYRIVASVNGKFAKERNEISHVLVWVSDISVITRDVQGGVEGFVLDSVSGEPVQKATVKVYSSHEYYQKDRYIRKTEIVKTLHTDENGQFASAIKLGENYNGAMIYAADNKGNEIFDPRTLYFYGGDGAEPPYEQTMFFTDRSLYRPGQIINFKGICFAVDRAGNNYKVLSGRKVKAVLRDANYQEVTSAEFTANDFGSFAGSFNAPADRALGAMTIEAQGPSGSCQVRVEEYKRPKFTVELKVPEEGFRLGDTVRAGGQAMAYTGAPIDGAVVKYRVVRTVRMPNWWNFYWGGFSAISSAEQEIANGKTKTDAGGSFEVSFIAKPDLDISKEDDPTFNYRISADVTDSAGETRSDQKTIRVGYTALEATLSADGWLPADAPVKIEVGTATLDGKPLSAEGQVQIYALAGPEKPVPAELLPEYGYWYFNESRKNGEKNDLGGVRDAANFALWPAGSQIEQKGFLTSGTGSIALEFKLKPGAYKALLTTNDRFGSKVKSVFPFMVIDPGSEKFDVKVPDYYISKNDTLEPGDKFKSFWGTGYEGGRAFVEVRHGGKAVKKYWTRAGINAHLIEVPVEEKHRGGFLVMVTHVKGNRLYTNSSSVGVPWTSKKYDVKFETFRSKLLPGQEETWNIKVKGPGAESKAAEFVAAMYDESLDAFYPHALSDFMGVFHSDQSFVTQNFSNVKTDFSAWINNLNDYVSHSNLTYDDFMSQIVQNYHGYDSGVPGKSYRGGGGGRMKKAMRRSRDGAEDEMARSEAKSLSFDKEESVMAAPAPVAESPKEANGSGLSAPAPEKPSAAAIGGAKKPDLSKVVARKNLNETAFFFPQLTAGPDGTVKISFKMPEALTKWHFLGFAHGKNLENGSIEEHAVTQKDVMVQPNPPRFLREGDELEFAVKVTNMVDSEIKGSARLAFSNPVNEKPLNQELGNKTTDVDFTIAAKQSKSFTWRIVVPDGLETVKFSAVASTGDKSDGEEGVIPVLSRRIFVQEAIALPVRGPEEKKFKFEKLLNSAKSDTLVNKGFTVQMTSNPSWYAVQALPFLMEFPHECSEQIFNRLYANALAKHIADSDPKIRRVFDLWRGTDALKSNLEKNEELKSVRLLETPWVCQAKNESEAKRNVGILFDDNRLKNEISGAFEKLKSMQLPDGSWPWFPGGRSNSYITLYIVTGFGRLKHLEVNKVSFDAALRALDHLDGWINEMYREILKYGHKDQNNLTSTVALYLYGRSFYLKDRPIADNAREAVDYFLDQSKKYWLKLDSRMNQGHLAIALKRFGDEETAKKIMVSIKERSQSDAELGMFWGELELSWWWYRAPIETQALMIEAFDEVMNDVKSVEDCKVWLLKQKQTQDWKTTTATADSIYALLCRGENLLASDALVEVTVGGKKIEPEKVEAGTGFYEKRFDGSEVRPEFGDITVKKTDKGVAWGGAHWQYMEDMTKVTPHEQNPLKLKKSVFVERQTKSGLEITPVSGALEVGDLLAIRIELRTDRDMEYVHMKDGRGSGLEPVNVLSQYKYQDGLAYYESTRDSATHFYIDYLPKGTYVFEYRLRVQHKGKYANGMAQIECMYAPEFNSHSESVKLEVK